MTEKVLLITGCTDPLMWYAGLVGQEVPFLIEHPDCYMGREPAGYSNMVHKKDAEIVDKSTKVQKS